MKKIILFFAVFQLLCVFNAFSQEVQEGSVPVENNRLLTKVQFTLPKINFRMDEGVSYCQVTRIEKQEQRSNFVRENMMLGAYYNLETVDLSFFDLNLNVSAYYPFYQAFNGMKQKPKNLFNYALNGFFGAKFNIDKFKYFNLSFNLGMHYMYQLTDEYYMHYVGIGGFVGIDFPLTDNWSIVERNFVAYDNANLGSNKNIQPFDGSYQYHIDLGVRYSAKSHNKYYFIDTTEHKKKVEERKANREAIKKAKESIK